MIVIRVLRLLWMSMLWCRWSWSVKIFWILVHSSLFDSPFRQDFVTRFGIAPFRTPFAKDTKRSQLSNDKIFLVTVLSIKPFQKKTFIKRPQVTSTITHKIQIAILQSCKIFQYLSTEDGSLTPSHLEFRFWTNLALSELHLASLNIMTVFVNCFSRVNMTDHRGAPNILIVSPKR